MGLLGIFSLVFICVSVISGAPRGHEEHDTIHFYFDPDGSYLVSQTESSCFLAKLTHDEIDHVHTNRGMEDLELLMLRDMLGKLNETRVYHDSTLPGNIQKWCSDRDLFILERPLYAMAMPTCTCIPILFNKDLVTAACFKLQLLMLRNMLGKLNETRVYHDSTLPGNIQKWCSDRDLFILERPLYAMAMPTCTCIPILFNKDLVTAACFKLQLLMLRNMLGKLNETRVYHDSTLPGNIQKWCSDRDLFILERPLDAVMTTSTSLLG